MKVTQPAIVGLRVVQLLCIASLISGFVWASSDWLLLFVLLDAPVAPLSVLLMLYGILGTATIEIPIRMLERRGKNREAMNENGGRQP